ncbi:hypothetical protein Tco_0406969 [Tanacetum coccineum]
MEAHCIALELKYQNQALKSGQHDQILNETSNKAKIKKEIDVLETVNIELEHSVAKLLKENETLKKHYKDLYDYIKITRSKTIEQTTSLLANNADLKAQIQEKEVISRAKIQSHKTRNNSKLVDQKSHTQKPGRQIITEHRFSPNNTSAVYEKTSPRSDLSWKVYSVLCSTNNSNGENQVVSKSFAVTTADTPDKRQQQPDSTSSTSTQVPTFTADGNFDIFKRRCCNHVPAKSDSLPHTHTRALKVNHSASRLFILNVLILKDLQSQIKNHILGRLLALCSYKSNKNAISKSMPVKSTSRSRKSNQDDSSQGDDER